MAVRIKDREYVLRPLKTKDVFLMSRIIRKMNLDVDFKSATSQEQAGAEVIFALLTHFGDAEQELSEFLGSLIGMTAQAFGEMDLGDMMAVLMALKSLPGIDRFFDMLGRSMQ